MNWQKPPDAEQEFKANLALEAKKKNHWIFSKTTKKWYTPEEFAFSKEDIHVHRGHAKAPQLVIMDPRKALDIANNHIEKASTFIKQHTQKMWKYYNIQKKN
ncbi:hypothetical protein [Pedobacter sp. MW01-1-1]|uniref:hypothetical protein n=1 Tax=Pedobacter sp. MW01-1-1 TaxID=3383027 RepID=UPI003FEFA0F5